MQPTAVRVHSKNELAASKRDDEAPRARCRLGLSPTEAMHAVAFVEGDSDDLLAVIREAATALFNDGCVARDRLLARHLALEANTISILVSLIGERARVGDAAGALLADRLATSATRRLATLLGAAGKRASTVAIENAIVRIGGDE